MRSTAILLAFMLASGAEASPVLLDEPNEHPMDYVWTLPDDEQVELALELLERGADDERRWIAEYSDVLLMDLDSDEDDTWAIEGMDRLRAWIAREQDDFVLSRVIYGIGDFEEEIVKSLFLELLSHPSPNVRHQAIAHYVDWGENPAALPVLERMWATESREWIRDDLMIALADLGSTKFIDEFVAETESEDLVRADLALHALSYLDDPRSLIELSEDPAHPLRVRALERLTFSDSSRTHEVLLRASHNPDDEVRSVAVNSLRRVGDVSEVLPRLLDVARSDDNPDIRRGALGQLDNRDAEVRKILEAVVRGPRTPENESLVSYAESQLAPPPPEDPFYLSLLERARAGEEIDWEIYGYEIRYTTHSCGASPIGVDTPGVLMLRSDRRRKTVRCSSAPGVAADFVVNPRIRESSLVTIAEYHEYQGDLWVDLAGGPIWNCWVPREFLVEVPDDWAEPSVNGESLHGEFDVFMDDRRVAAIRNLANQGTAEFFDRDERSRVEAVAVDLRPTSGAIVALLDSYRGTVDSVDGMIHALLGQVPAELTLEPELRSRLDRLFPEEDTESTSP